MKAKSDIIYETLSSDEFTMWFCDVFVPHTLLSKAKRTKGESEMKDAITRHFRPLFVQTGEEQDATKPTPEVTKPAAETKPKPAKKKTEARVNVVITGAPEPKHIEPESFEAKPKDEASVLDSTN
jgi:hypothetical protein